MSQHLAKTYLLTLGIAITACGKSSFVEIEKPEDSAASSDNAQPHAPGNGTAELPTGEGDPNNPNNPGTPDSENCFENPQDKTSVRLLTESVQMSAANQWLQYEVSLIDCWGNPKPIPQAALLFDIDAVAVRTINHGLNFQIDSQQGEVLSSGTLTFITGVDLFGKQGANYFHWSMQDLSFVNNDMKLVLHVDVSNLGWRSYPGRNEAIPGGYQFSTFLRLGDAKPVEQKVKWLVP